MGILEKYELDFMMCGYHDTLSELHTLINQKVAEEDSNN